MAAAAAAGAAPTRVTTAGRRSGSRTSALTLPLALALLALVLALSPSLAAAQKAVAFGDSVTKGFVPTSDANIPYTLTLERLLRSRFGGNARVDNSNSGAAALLPASQKALMAPPIYGVLSTPQASEYNWAIFMLGTNDILMGNRRAGEVIGAMRPLVDAALAKGAKVVLLSMPPTSISTPNQERERQLLNEAEKQLAREYRARGKSVTTVDLDDNLYASLNGGFNKPQARVVLEDGVHLCRLCYEQLGRIVYKALGAEAGWCGGGRYRGAAVLSARQVGALSC